VFPELLARCSALLPEQVATLEAHYELLLRWNKVLNLTTISGLVEAVDRHYCESLFLAERLPVQQSIVDIGSGAGVPGFVVAVARPGCSVTLIESHQRKAVFLREASRRVPNVRVVAARAETVDERFKWVVSRAVSYDDLSRSAPVLADSIALLTGVEMPPSSWGFDWESVPVPSGDQRFLRLGHRVTVRPHLT
jgi:16S rRNA (guanine(527)-N(7))-methyltransferase RsmG